VTPVELERRPNPRKAARIEAYGVKGMKSRPWRRTFKDADALIAWCEENDAQVYAQRDADGR